MQSLTEIRVRELRGTSESGVCMHVCVRTDISRDKVIMRWDPMNLRWAVVTRPWVLGAGRSDCLGLFLSQSSRVRSLGRMEGWSLCAGLTLGLRAEGVCWSQGYRRLGEAWMVSVGFTAVLGRKRRYTLSVQIFRLTPAHLLRVKANISHVLPGCQSLFTLNESLTVSVYKCCSPYSEGKLLSVIQLRSVRDRIWTQVSLTLIAVHLQLIQWQYLLHDECSWLISRLNCNDFMSLLK